METSHAAAGQPSGSALTAAAARAAHLIVDGQPTIFADPLAAALLGGRAEELIGYHCGTARTRCCPAPGSRSPAAAGTRRTRWPGPSAPASPST